MMEFYVVDNKARSITLIIAKGYTEVYKWAENEFKGQMFSIFRKEDLNVITLT